MMNRIKELREAKGISMKEAARRLGLPYTTYVNYEKGAREPNSEALIKIADFFGVSIDYLIKADSITTKKTPTGTGERSVSDDELKFALWGDCQDVSDDDLADVLRYAAFVRERKKDKK